MDKDMKIYWYWLLSLDGITTTEISRLLDIYGDPEGVFTYCRGEELTDLQRAAMDYSRCRFEGIKQEYFALAGKGIHMILRGDPDYPERLKGIDGEPYGLFLMGSLPDPGKIAAAIVGARRATQHGRWMAAKLGEDLARCGVNVISGMAEGIDGCSQMGALNASGYTLAVLGTGVDICFPRAHTSLYERLKVSGGILSEYVPGTPGAPYRFPARNRLISALSDVVIVVEAKERSGSLITVSHALSQGREVMAVPGRPDDPCSVSCNRLIREGAGCCTCAGDVLDYLQVSPAFMRSPAYTAANKPVKRDKQGKSGGTGAINASLTVQEALVLSVLSGEPKHTDIISAETGIPVSQLNAILIKMQLKGYISGVANSLYSSK